MTGTRTPACSPRGPLCALVRGWVETQPQSGSFQRFGPLLAEETRTKVIAG